MRSSFCIHLVVAIILIVCRCDATFAQRQPAIQSEKEFRRAIYAEVPMMSNGGTGADACVRLLNATGTAGCATPGVKAAEGRLLRLDALLPRPEDYPGAACSLGVVRGTLRHRQRPLRAGRSPRVALEPRRLLPAEDVAVLLPPALLPAFLGQCGASPALARRVRGVLLDAGPPPDYSDAQAAPLASFALYANRSYAWNPAGGCCPSAPN